jgi:nicotinamidase-related amidase
MKPNTTALIVIDVQLAWDNLKHWGGARNNPDAEANIARLIGAFRATNAPIYHVRHASVTPGSPLRPDHPGHQPKPEAKEKDGEPIILKSVNSAFIGTNLEAQLRERGITTVVICGVQTDHCCTTTARMAGNFGFKVLFVDDANWTYDRVHPDGTRYEAELIHRVHVTSLSNEFAEIVQTGDVISSLKF